MSNEHAFNIPEKLPRGKKTQKVVQKSILFFSRHGGRKTKHIKILQKKGTKDKVEDVQIQIFQWKMLQAGPPTIVIHGVVTPING